MTLSRLAGSTIAVWTLGVSSLGVSASAAQQLTKADSNLVYAILTAEDRRDSLAPALAEGVRHADARVRLIAERARGRITDSLFAARSALPAPAPRVRWPLPPWRARYDSLRDRRNDCTAMATALRESAIQVRLRAIDLLTPACADSGAIVATLAEWVAHLPDPPAEILAPAAWLTGAHALVALARLRPDIAAVPVARLSTHYTWQVRMYAARAARTTADTGLLRRMARDRNGNVAEAAVEALAAVSGHADDGTYLAVLRSKAPQVVRAAAIALKGSTDPRVRTQAQRALGRWNRRRRDSERDARLALLDLLGRPARDDIAWRKAEPLPREVVALALGKAVDLSVLLSSGRDRAFTVRLRGDIAPITAARVLALVDRGKYRGGSWHRVIPDFVIQGGLAGANEYVGGSHFFRDELGNVSHLRGGVGMSTRGHDTGDGQWFIDLSDLPRLDRDYTLFGEVVAGMALVDEVLEGEKIVSITRHDRARGAH